MTTLEIPSLSVEPVTAQWTSTSDPTALVVEFNFTTDDNDPSTGWVTGTWGTAVLQTEGEDKGKYYTEASVDVGPGTTFGALTEGVDYVGWTRADSKVIRRFARIKVT